MIVFRRIWVISLLLLTACTPKPPVIEASQNLETPPTKEKPTTQAETTSHVMLESQANNETVTDKKETTTSKTAPLETIKEVRADNSSTSKITSWEISGALAARSKGKGWSASINWLQRGLSSYQIRLSGPLGSGAVMINRNGGLVTLRDGPKTASSSNAESLLRKQTGVSLPVTNLYYWARGIAAPGAIQGKKYDQAGRLLVLRQAGYTIEYQQYTFVGKAILPSSIRLQGNGIFIKLIIKKWRV